MSNILYVVENNRSTSHLIVMKRVVAALVGAGHQVFVSSMNKIDAGDLPSGVKVFTQTTADQPYRGQPQSLDALWIIQGMADLATITPICAAYATLVAKYRINLIVADSSPIVQLFAFTKKVPIVTVQSAYTMPPVAPHLRGLMSGAYVNMQDSVTLKNVINEYLFSKEAGEVLDMSDIYTKWGTHLTTSHKVLDAFCLASDFTRELTYFPPITDGITDPAPVWRKDGVLNVVVYADHNKRMVPEIITQLMLADDANVVLVSSDVFILSQLPADLRNKLTYLRSPLASLSDYTTTADLVVCNANEVTTSSAIKAGVPVIAIPVQFNQKDISNWLVVNHIGVEINVPADITSALSTIVTSLSTYAANCTTYAAANLTETLDPIGTVLIHASAP